jgi:p-hydroxybenzoate 3-monooxygenase
MRTQVGIVGAGPAGLLLSLLLHRAGVDCVVLESRSRDYVETRVRAGVLEQGTVDLMDDLGAGERLHREGMPDPRLDIRYSGGIIHIDMPVLTPGKIVTVYGQQEVVKDLIAARLSRGGATLFEAEATDLEGLDSARPIIHFTHEGENKTLECDIVAGCDGFHGICRGAIPEHLLTIYDRVYPFGWLGILAEAKPFPEMTYSSSERGFSLASRRSPKLSRLYVQCNPDDTLEAWPDRRIWDELHTRLYDKDGGELREGPILQRGVIELRAFVAAPMRHGRMFLAGDAAHIVPPTGAKGLNLAASDAHYLATALREYYEEKSSAGIDDYSATSLKRVWKAVRFSWWMTQIMHKFPDTGAIGARFQLAELDYVVNSKAAMTSLSENYVGLPL